MGATIGRRSSMDRNLHEHIKIAKEPKNFEALVASTTKKFKDTWPDAFNGDEDMYNALDAVQCSIPYPYMKEECIFCGKPPLHESCIRVVAYYTFCNDRPFAIFAHNECAENNIAPITKETKK